MEISPQLQENPPLKERCEHLWFSVLNNGEQLFKQKMSISAFTEFIFGAGLPSGATQSQLELNQQELLRIYDLKVGPDEDGMDYSSFMQALKEISCLKCFAQVA
eukprot:gene21534-1213_t